MIRALAIAALLTLSTPFPAAAQVDCAALNRAWVAAEKAIAMETVGNIGDTNTPRETVRVIRISNAIAIQSGNLLLMQQAKCPPPPSSVGEWGRFSKAAFECGTARINFTSTTKEPIPAQCKTNDWVPVPIAEKP